LLRILLIKKARLREALFVVGNLSIFGGYSATKSKIKWYGDLNRGGARNWGVFYMIGILGPIGQGG